MDIRKFFGKRIVREKSSSSSSSDTDAVKPKNKTCRTTSPESASVYPENDIGNWVGRSSNLSVDKKKEILLKPWTPDIHYNFSTDAEGLKRKFRHQWLQMYSPWLAYSGRLKGAFCIYCVLFPASNVRGVLGSLVIRPFNKYKDANEVFKAHASSEKHKEAVRCAKNFVDNIPVDMQMQRGHTKIVEENKKLLSVIISTIIFCGSHDIALRGKEANSGTFIDLIKMTLTHADENLLKIFNRVKGNARYTSVRIQNEIISMCGDVIKERICASVKQAVGYSILADESCDISGKEQLSIGVRFFDDDSMVIREDFLGFVELEAMDAKYIATAIQQFILNSGLDPQKCFGQGYDGCATMSGKDNGVQKIMREHFERALFFHCSSHKLNLVVNDLNAVPEIRNSTSTLKDIINFFRESPLRKKYAPNLPMLCETRWSQKYKAIGILKKKFVSIVEGLEKLISEGNRATKKHAFQLHSVSLQSSFFISLCIIGKYSEILEPTVNVMQSKELNILSVNNHIQRLIQTFKDHRRSSEHIFKEIYEEAESLIQTFGCTLEKPRVIGKQVHRSNPPATSVCEYFRRSIYIPYMDSLVSSQETRFSHVHTPAFELTNIHPQCFKNMTLNDLKSKICEITSYYKLEGIENEIEMWYDLWKEKGLDEADDFVNILKEADPFFPKIRDGLRILYTLPYTSATVERSFSTLRRVKTWLRSTMAADRLNGLCMLSAHRELLKNDDIANEVLEKFAANPRRLAFD